MKPQLVARLSKALKSEENDSISAEHLNESNTETTENKADSNDVNECGSNDSMDIDLDLDNIVVIDEYDSTKNDCKNDSSSKRVRTIL